MQSPNWRRLGLAGLILSLALAAAWWLLDIGRRQALPAGIASGNGRLEAVEIDLATRAGGRIAAVHAQEGEEVAAGQVVVELDAAELQAQRRAAQAQLEQAGRAVDAAQAAERRKRADLGITEHALGRSRDLVGRGFVSSEKLDRDQGAVDGARADLAQAQGQVAQARAGVAAARAQLEVLDATLADQRVAAPLAARVLYRLVQPGEVVAPGARLLTLLDLSDVHMSIYLPSAQAGRIAIGSEARILLDALPDQPLPARVSQVSPRAQFTPKEVETRNEREKLMFRVKVSVDAGWLAAHRGLAKPGMPGVAYLPTEPGVAWPAQLQPK